MSTIASAVLDALVIDAPKLCRSRKYGLSRPDLGKSQGQIFGVGKGLHAPVHCRERIRCLYHKVEVSCGRTAQKPNGRLLNVQEVLMEGTQMSPVGDDGIYRRRRRVVETRKEGERVAESGRKYHTIDIPQELEPVRKRLGLWRLFNALFR